ncbi:hypothetical protein DAPPUDRAFT_114227 [Daphnia pulex]|uniref:Uncharacterized protein n=1 Tax=Daphnia pulex TaxID=6669 RepID=E9HHG3_DAPPU|nr:hypothetical protein DAPPUDRAFT_114227 [Daphnia pulex]|eukprot:EFX68772.1 hypothetical protein DAPPUDRAFT_114227 [Daphnia pulex]
MPPANNTVQCSMCTLLIAVDDPTTFFKHVKQKHSCIVPFHIICRHPDSCNKHYYVFLLFRRHWNKVHGSQTKFVHPIHVGNIQVALGPDEDIVDVAAAEAFDIAGPTLYQQTITEFEWEAGMLYQLRHKYFLPFEALLLVSDIIRDSYDRNVVMIQENLRAVVSNNIFGSTAFTEAFQRVHQQEQMTRYLLEATWNQFFPAVMPREVILNPIQILVKYSMKCLISDILYLS